MEASEIAEIAAILEPEIESRDGLDRSETAVSEVEIQTEPETETEDEYPSEPTISPETIDAAGLEMDDQELEYEAVTDTDTTPIAMTTSRSSRS
ncbi:MAG: hypothetical protein HC795_06585 [Coleofasciculaceae cyanobacterium RL_1_1]|nr:hypothetical protein [Coleofasciculaceae cyanobacterium RL_1_1]